MTKTYSYELSVFDLQRLQKDLKKVQDIIQSDEFKKYLGEKLEEALKFIQKTSLSTINSDEDIEMSTYMNSNHLEIEGDTIYIYNDAKIDITSKNMRETTKARYPAQLSLAKIVEYGIGYTGGAFTPQEDVEDWAYDVQGHGAKGWYYKDDSGVIHWTNGFAGRLIFAKLKEFVKAYIEKWIIDYMNEKL